MFRTLHESKNAETKVRQSIYEYFGISPPTYLACSKDLKSKISRLYHDVVVNKGKTLCLFHLIFLLWNVTCRFVLVLKFCLFFC